MPRNGCSRFTRNQGQGWSLGTPVGNGDHDIVPVAGLVVASFGKKFLFFIIFFLLPILFSGLQQRSFSFLVVDFFF